MPNPQYYETAALAGSVQHSRVIAGLSERLLSISTTSVHLVRAIMSEKARIKQPRDGMFDAVGRDVGQLATLKTCSAYMRCPNQ